MLKKSSRTCSNCSSLSSENIELYIGNKSIHNLNSKIKTPDPHCNKCGNIAYYCLRKDSNISPQTKLLIINGPSGSHKTSVSHLISQYYNYIQLDWEWIRDKLSKQKKQYNLTLNDIHADILFMTEWLLNLWKNVVISQTIDPDFWQLYKYFLKERNIDYTLITLMPKYKDLHLDLRQYDKNIPEDEVLETEYQKFLNSEVFKSSFYDNSWETTEQTVLQLTNIFIIQQNLLTTNNSSFVKEYIDYSNNLKLKLDHNC